MTTRSRLASGVRVLCGGLEDAPLNKGGLPEHVIYEVLLDCETSMLIDLDLSEQNRRVNRKVIPLSRDNFLVNAPDWGAPAFAQLKLNPTDTQRPEKVDIVNLSAIDDAGHENRLAVAFYDTPQKAQLSWLPQPTDQHTLILWYDRTVDMDGDLGDEPPIADAYTVHLKLQAVAQVMELLKQPVGDVLKARIDKGEEQWQRNVRMSRQQGVVKKRSSHPRQGRRSAEFQRPGGGSFF